MSLTVANNRVISIDYVLTDSQGQIIDSSKEAGPLDYIHGTGHLIPGLEKALEGKAAGENIKVTIQPKDGYGEIRQEMIQSIPRTQFDSEGQIEVGMQFMAHTDDGRIILRVVKVEGDQVVVDGNHPLAGVVLHFNVDVKNIREASPEELRHGHIHGGAGCGSHGEGGGGCCGGEGHCH